MPIWILFILFYFSDNNALTVFSETTRTPAIDPRSGILALVLVASYFLLVPFVCGAWRPKDGGLVVDLGVDKVAFWLLAVARG